MRVLAVIAHPDDEVIGCGGTLSKLAEEGHDVHVLLPIKRGDPGRIDHWESHLDAFVYSCTSLGVTPIMAENFIDERQLENNLHTLHDTILPAVEWSDLVLTHWLHDANQTHCAVSRAVEIATRPFRRRKKVYLFETVTSTDQAYFHTFYPNSYSILTEYHVKKKYEAMSFYTTEEESGRSSAGLLRKAQQRGDEIGDLYAEAFHITREYF